MTAAGSTDVTGLVWNTKIASHPRRPRLRALSDAASANET
jgi:hypothetical protein